MSSMLPAIVASCGRVVVRWLITVFGVIHPIIQCECVDVGSGVHLITAHVTNVSQ